MSDAIRQLRDDQQQAIDAVRATAASGVRRIMLMAPTGWGKTIIAADVVRRNMARGLRSTFVVDTIQLVDQTVERFFEEGIVDVGVLQANHPMENPHRPVQVVSIQTLMKRGIYPSSDLVVIDEAHVLHRGHKTWLENPGKTLFVGLSATPYTRGLGNWFDTLVPAATTSDMIARGILCPPKVFSASHPDLKRRLKKVKVEIGEYAPGQLSETMRDRELSGDVVRSWQELWGRDKTLCFCVDLAHAQAMQARFTEAGVRCAYQDAGTSRVEREAIRRGFHDGGYQVVCSVGTMTKGLDWDVRCISLARPTKSQMLFKQIIGRGLRTAPGKEFCLVLDHGRCTQELGFVTEIEYEELDRSDGAGERKAEIKYAKECPKCRQFKPRGARRCDNCGFEPTPQCGWTENEDALEEVDRKTLPKGHKREVSELEKRKFFAEVNGYAFTKGYKPGFALMKFKSKYGHWPERHWHETKAPGAATLSWLKAEQIRWAKSKSNPANAVVAPKPKPVDPSDCEGVPVTQLPPDPRLAQAARVDR